MYTLSSSPSAERDIARLKLRAPRQDFERLHRTIRSLTEEPRPRGIRKLKGLEETYRIRVGNYRIIYKVYDDTKVVAISNVLRRNEGTYRA